MSAAGPSGNVRRFVKTKLRPELDYGCDSGGWSRHLKESNLTCQSLSSLVLTSNYSIFVELKILIWFTYWYSTFTCHIGQTEVHKSLLSRKKVKTRDELTCIFAFLKMMLYSIYGLLFTAWVTKWMGGVVVDVASCSLHHAWQFADHNLK